MNCYAWQGLVLDAIGRDQWVAVVVPCHRRREVVDFMALTAERVTGVEFVRANRREQLRFDTGGRVTLHVPSAYGLRGLSPNVVYVEDWHEFTPAQQEGIAFAANQGELVRA